MLEASVAWEVANSFLRKILAFWSWGQDRWGHRLVIERRYAPPHYPLTLASTSTIKAADIEEGMVNRDVSELPDFIRNTYSAQEFGERQDVLRLRSVAKRNLVIDAVEVLFEGRDENPWGALVHWPTGGANTAIYLGFDFTASDHPSATVASQDGGIEWTGKPYFPNHDISLAPGEAQSLTVLSRTAADTVRWRLKVTYGVGGHFERTVVFPPKGEDPIITTGNPNADQYWYSGLAVVDPLGIARVSREEFCF